MTVEALFGHGARLSFDYVSFANSAHFSQKRVYGIGWAHCFVVDDGSGEIPEELRGQPEPDFGPMDDAEGCHTGLPNWFQPDWEHALRIMGVLWERANTMTIDRLRRGRPEMTEEQLAQAVAHRREYDLFEAKLPKLQRLIEYCATPERRPYCRVRLA
jgi:hypothetical protein